MAAALTSTVAEIERRLGELRVDGDVSMQRTSVLTHIAWIPPRWRSAAAETLVGLGERHPSRTILLYPEPDAEPSGLRGEVERECFSRGERTVCVEVIRIGLRGRTATAPASVVQPLLLPSLPVFLRWRGAPPFAGREFRQLAGAADRLIIDTGEWDELTLGELVATFDRVQVSDLAWRRTLPWRVRIAGRWPFAAETLSVCGPEPEARLLAGWLRSRLRARVDLRHEPAAVLESVAVDGEPVEPPPSPPMAPGDLLSAELDAFGRDPVYEEAVTRA